jgi:hypothetical protein
MDNLSHSNIYILFDAVEELIVLATTREWEMAEFLYRNFAREDFVGLALCKVRNGVEERQGGRPLLVQQFWDQGKELFTAREAAKKRHPAYVPPVST